jgi:hypothetical protein
MVRQNHRSFVHYLRQASSSPKQVKRLSDGVSYFNLVDPGPMAIRGSAEQSPGIVVGGAKRRTKNRQTHPHRPTARKSAPRNRDDAMVATQPPHDD